MSQTNSFQPWKQTLPVGLPSNLGSAIFGGTTAVSAAAGYGKVPALPPPPQQPTPSPSSSSSSSSSLSSVSSSTPAPCTPTGGPPMHTPLLTIPSPGGGAVSSSTSSTGGGTDFLAQMAVNKLKLGKLNASYELSTVVGAASHPPPSQAGGGDEMDMDQSAEHDPSVAAMKAMLASSGCHNPAALGDRDREQQIQQIFEKSISDNTKKQIVEILEKISTLRPPERLLLYLRMPGGYPETDPLRQSQNPLGTRQEINHTINWVRSHLEHDPNVSIPKQEVYDDYVAYCARINIKPLSTADFGKVMKQVFPGIRPRRLGTRGHSRYCYAAMRKATKLPIPKLPDLSSAGGSIEKQSNEGQSFNEEESWKVVKAWAEAMLPSCFTTINELASFIAKNNLNSPSGIGSRQQLHKKILQRELKEKRKLSAVALKKRRKKRRKTLSTSICDAPESRNTSTPDKSKSQIGAFGGVETQQQQQQHQRTVSTKQQQQQPTTPIDGGLNASCNGSAPSGTTNQLLQHMIKREQQDYLDEDNNNTTSGGKMMLLQRQQQQHQQQQQQQQHQSTNLNCDTSNGVLESLNKDLIMAVAASGFLPPSATGMPSVIAHGPHPPPHVQQQQLMQQRLLEGGMRSPQDQQFLQNVYCKKVRQAQQLKAVQQAQQQQQQQQQQAQLQLQQQQQQPSTGHAQSPLFFPNRPTSVQKRQLANSVAFAGRQKRLKLLQQRQQRSLEAQNNSAPRYDEQGNLILIETQDPTTQDEFIIPRERVISICNMDKNALDGYLNCEEENSQDQDQELLKYFPEEDGTGGNTTQQQLDASSVENDGATGGPSSSFGTGMFDDNEKLFQIRMILEKNQSNQNKQQMLQHQQQQQQMQQALESHLAGYESAGTMNQAMGGLQPGSAAASLAALSQRHNTTTSDPSTVGGDPSSTAVLAPDQHQRQQLKPHEGGLSSQPYGMNQMNGTTPGSSQTLSQALQSPTARRKNFSFVPISEQPRGGGPGAKKLSGNSNINHTPTDSPFVSPRSTPIHRKALKASNGLTLNLTENKFNNHQAAHGQHHQQQLQLTGVGSYNLPQQAQHQQQQPRSYLSGYIKNELPASAPPSPSMMQPYRFGPVAMNGMNCGISPMPSTFQPICNPHGSLSSSTTGGGGGGSHGGPISSLESRSSSVPLIPNYDAYCNSNYNSVSQTPVPSEYDDFTETSNILDMLNEQSSQLTAAVKIEESELTLPELLPEQLQQQQEDGGGSFFTRSANYNIVSRSVPSTPLPHLGGFRASGSSTASGTGNCIGGPMGGPGGLGMVTARSMFELPKSVPSTPIALNDASCQGESMFQYSPETSRDFLINGNSVDRSKSSTASFYSPVTGGNGSGNSASSVSGSLAMTTKGSDPIGAGGNGAPDLGASHTTTTVHSTSSATADPIAPPSADLASVLSDGIEGLSNELDSMAESMINSDILRNL
ncbi:uncharacterized protein LOC126556709 [Anopheles maculipalpis]|uniref:uncharacterized protein LOC126556709 n=1 Tax=Anopheles maculipalpis TaxID=1496333 RepID=UPI00215964A1|nr:uncharacterized protein LOC126556709 [Anopheles maculipalpis]